MNLTSLFCAGARRWLRSAIIAALGFAAFAANAALVTVSNGIYDIHVMDGGGSTGSWNAVSGASSPVGPGRDIMFNGTTVSTNFSSLRIFGAAGVSTYTFAGDGGATNLDPFYAGSSPSAFGTAVNSLHQTWNITPANITLTQDLIATGTTFANSAIYHTVR